MIGFFALFLSTIYSMPARLGESDFEFRYGHILPAHAQTHAGPLARGVTGFWREDCNLQLADAQARWRKLRLELATETARLPKPAEVFEADEQQSSTQPSYGKIPEVRVDIGHGAIFPMPIKSPDRYSWFQVATRSARLLKSLLALERNFAEWKSLPDLQRFTNYPKLTPLFAGAHQEFVQVASRVRYLESWLPELRRIADLASSRGQIPSGERLALWATQSSAPSAQDTRVKPEPIRPDEDELREIFRPKRLLKRLFVPAELARFRGETVTIPIATDVADVKFLREFEGAIDTHWNRSPWARQQEIKFKIRWIPILMDAKFAHGIYTLGEHINSFPPGPAVLTTGGLTLHVRDRALVLGPDPVDARSLAHEFGHLLGFGDCYFRTLSSQGIYGEAVLEWSNPFYPDELMCDNTVGVVRAVVW